MLEMELYLQARVKTEAIFRPSNPNCYRKVQYPTPIEWKISHKIAYEYSLIWYRTRWYWVLYKIRILKGTDFSYFRTLINCGASQQPKKGWHWISQVWVKRMKMWWKTKHQIPLSWIMVSFRKLLTNVGNSEIFL